MFWQLAVAGNLLLIIATDALSFYLGFSAMSLSAYGLIVHRGGPGPRRAGRLYLQLAICGEMLLLAGLLLRTQAADQALDFASWQAQPIDHLTLALLLLGLGLKAGFWPLRLAAAGPRRRRSPGRCSRPASSASGAACRRPTRR